MPRWNIDPGDLARGKVDPGDNNRISAEGLFHDVSSAGRPVIHPGLDKKDFVIPPVKVFGGEMPAEFVGLWLRFDRQVGQTP